MDLGWRDRAGVFGIKPPITPILDAEARDLSSSGSTAPRSTRNKRRYSFDGTHFTKHDPNPHRVPLQPVVQMRQLTLLDNDVVEVVHSEAPLQDHRYDGHRRHRVHQCQGTCSQRPHLRTETERLLTVTHSRGGVMCAVAK